MHFIQWGWQSQPNWIIEHQTKKGTVRMTVNKETYINTLVDSMSIEDLQQYVANDMANFLYNCNESEVIKNEFLIKVEHTTDEQFYNKFVKHNKKLFL